MSVASQEKDYPLDSQLITSTEANIGPRSEAETEPAPISGAGNGVPNGRPGDTLPGSAEPEPRAVEKTPWRAEGQFDQLFAGSPIPMIITEVESRRVLDINWAFTDLLGYSREELEGKKPSDVGIWKNTEDRLRVLSAVQDGAPARDMAAELLTKSGEVRHVLLSSMIIGVKGQEALLTSCMDVTSHALAEEVLRKSESRYRSLIEQATDGIFLTDPHGKYIDVNPAGCSMVGYTLEEMLDLRMEDLIAPVDLARTPVRYRELREGGSVISERLLRRKDGTVVASEISGRTLPDGQMQAIVRDVSGRKRAEEELRFHAALLDQVQAAVVASDLEGTITHWNHYAEVLYGWSAAEAIDRKVSDLVVSDLDAEQAREIEEEINAKGRWEGEFAVQRKDGTAFPSFVVETLIRDHEGNPSGIIGVSVDITERKAGERRIKEHATSQTQLLHRLIYAQEAERRRLSMDLHDGPLQSLGVSLMAVDRALRRQERGEEDLVRKELQFLRANLASTVGEIRAVLADLSQEVLSTYGLATALTSHIERFADLSSISVEMSNSLNRRLPADTELLMYRLAQEAMTNIRKHSQAQSARISLQILGGMLYLKVTDDGKGFDVDEVLSQYEDGKHLGLKSMRERVQAAGGDLLIASTPGEGTTLEFRCPVPPKEQTVTLLTEDEISGTV